MTTFTSKKYTLSFNLSNYKLYFSRKANLTKISYLIQVLDSRNNSISPSDLALYYDLHIVCLLNINEVNITSLAGIEKDKYFKCTEFFNLEENFQIRFAIYRINRYNIKSIIKVSDFIDKNLFINKYENDSIFDISKIDYEYKFLISKLQNENNNIETKKLKKLYVSKPFFSLKRNLIKRENKWIFVNIFNEYFCFCKGFDCMKIVISKICKYYFYLYLIDKNHYIYKKTDFLLMDFIFKRFSSDDVYPVFEGMINRKISAHYLTEREDIYKKYCHTNNFCDKVILADEKSYKINDDFLEKHFTMILKLKQVLSSVGVNINFINNIFYNIDYITYICIGHGISYFKYYLYDQYYGPKNFDKLLIPNSKKLISVTIDHGWKDENLFKFNLPRWEKYNFVNESNSQIGNIISNSIFIMFTWREIKRRRKMSRNYLVNILNLLNNQQIINNLIKHNLTLYFTLHHRVLKYKKIFKLRNNLKYIDENNIAECLSKTQLVITDFSSIIFDMIYRRKPYIIFIPDANDTMIKINYETRCYDVIKKFQDNNFGFENVYFDINSTINKIIYYIDNNFQLDIKMNKFYDEFNFKKGPIIHDFIDNLLKL